MQKLYHLKLIEQDYLALKNINQGKFYTGVKVNHIDANNIRDRLISIAIGAKWRFGLNTKYIQLGSSENIFDYYNDNKKIIIVMDGSMLYQKQQHVKDFVAIVDHCYNGLIPIWVGMPVMPKQNGRTRSYKHRVNRMVSNSLDQLIPQSTLDRLDYLHSAT